MQNSILIDNGILTHKEAKESQRAYEYYKYQFYCPDCKYVDSYGYVHFISEGALERFKKECQKSQE